MRYLTLLLLLVTGQAVATWLNVTETRDLTIDHAGIERLEIRSGHGFVVVKGEPGRNDISVRADIRIPATSREKAAAIRAEYLDLALMAEGGTATLVGLFREYIVLRGDGPRVTLTVLVPDGIDVVIEDGTGFIEVSNLEGNLEIDDGSGSIDLENIGGSVSIRDGAGWIDVHRIDEDIVIEDRSGAISVSRVGGNVVIDDGAGRIKVRDVSGDLTLVDNSSGRFTFSGIEGVIRDQS